MTVNIIKSGKYIASDGISGWHFWSVDDKEHIIPLAHSKPCRACQHESAWADGIHAQIVEGQHE